MLTKISYFKLPFAFLCSAVVIGWGVLAFAQERFVDNNDGTVTDTFNEILWIKDPSVVPQIAGTKTWPDALKACEELVYAGKGPGFWKLPKIDELLRLVDSKFKNPQINPNFFTAEGSQYWSRTPYTPGARAWTLNFKNGALGGYDKSNPDKPALHNVRCAAKT